MEKLHLRKGTRVPLEHSLVLICAWIGKQSLHFLICKTGIISPPLACGGIKCDNTIKEPWTI